MAHKDPPLFLQRAPDGALYVTEHAEQGTRARTAEARRHREAYCVRCHEQIGGRPFHVVNERHYHAGCAQV